MTGLNAQADYSSARGAEALKEMLEAYWNQRGHNVRISIRSAGFHQAMRACRFEIESDMVNGFPQAGGDGDAGKSPR